MKYIEGKIFVSPAGLEPLAALLDGHGVHGLAIEDPRDAADLLSGKMAGTWDYLDEALLEAGRNPGDEITVSFYLEDTRSNAETLQMLRLDIMKLKGLELEGNFGTGLSLGRLYMETSLRSDDEWKDTWKQYFKPLRMTDRLTVKPSWESYTPESSEERIIELDPGMAFGTGRHESTLLCTRLLEEAIRPGDRVLDVGCGSGILSIAAALLGAGEVLATEIDEDAAAVATENIRLNGCADRVRVVKADLTRGISFCADVVAANLTADLIAALSGMLGACLKTDGIFLASGLLTEKRAGACAALEKNGFRIIGGLEDGEWCALKANRAEAAASPQWILQNGGNTENGGGIG
ncbi:MAG: 50S ribosomal protein L11 methyltransferase [Clostridiales Family XIII bacterium]|jgi:ribosomal protein L11 methyltransferase|nr:50S ribosomal protein L11 methyltransferase [Clostridiales Family XIII bacterium]